MRLEGGSVRSACFCPAVRAGEPSADAAACPCHALLPASELVSMLEGASPAGLGLITPVDLCMRVGERGRGERGDLGGVPVSST